MRYPLFAASCGLLVSLPLFSQALSDQSPAAAALAAEDEIVRLSPFEVSSAAPARYQAAEAAAGGRISTSIMDSPTTVTVLTSDFLSDVGGTRVLDATKYVAGVGESSIPNAIDRMNIRGFQTDGRIVDGFRTGSQANYDHGAIERVEVVKGPDSVLHPAGTPGGAINLVTKKPQWTHGGSLKLQVGEYDSNRFEADVTGPLSERFAYRMVAAAQDNEGYVDNIERHSYLLMPSLTWRIAPQTNLTLRYEYYDFKGSNHVGHFADPSVGTNDKLFMYPGVPYTFNPSSGLDYEHRTSHEHTGTVLFTSTLTDRLSVRLAGRIAEVATPDSDLRLRVDEWGSVNPYTGAWEAGVKWEQTSIDPAPRDFASTPLPPFNPIIALTGTQTNAMVRFRDLQNDWSYIVDSDSVTSTTLIGFAYAYQSSNRQEFRRTAPSIDTSKGEFNPATPAVVGPMRRDLISQSSRYQIYATQQLEFFNKRLILSGGVAHLTFNGLGGDRLAAADPAPKATVAGQVFPGSGSKATYNYGIVVKPLETVSLYYGHAENAVPSGDYKQMAFGDAPIFSESEQDEFGVKANLLGGRIIASIAYYESEQSGFPVFNPGNYANPQPPTLLPAIITTRKGSGWEYQFTGSLTESLSVIASYTDTKNRNPDGMMFNGAAEEMAAAYVHYSFRNTGALRGLSIAVGANYSGKRAAGNVSGRSTLASTLDAPIPEQTVAYLPSYTLTNVSLSYTRGAWSYGLTLHNALDETYAASAGNRYRIYVGSPRNLSGSLSWKF